MAVGDVQKRVVNTIGQILNCAPAGNARFDWLTNAPTSGHCGVRFENVQSIFRELGGDQDSLVLKRRTSLRPDAYFEAPWNFILEFDELQHFTKYRQSALSKYPTNAELGFDKTRYLEWCQIYGEKAIRKGPAGYRKPKPEFPFENGRAAQRAFFDSVRDLLPCLNGLRPTIRIAEFELPDAVYVDSVLQDALRILLGSKFEMAGISKIVPRLIGQR